MEVKIFVFNAFYENTYLVYDTDGKVIIVDPGCYEKFEQEELVGWIEKEDLQPIAILNTHCHIDHVLGNNFLKEKYNIPLYVPRNELETYRAIEAYAPSWGISNYDAAEIDHLIDHEDPLEIHGINIDVIYAPGHSPGHLMFFFKKEGFVLGGDVLFRESIGRTDLPGGDFNTLSNSILENVYTLPESVTIYPGHGPATTIGHERINNPFVKI